MERPVRRGLKGFAAAAAVAFACAWVAPATAAVPSPKVEGPITARGVHESPAHSAATILDLARRGYSESEYFVSGVARSIGSPSVFGGPELPGSSPYKTRMLVRRPLDPARFNGTVLVEWMNVTTGQDVDPLWIWTHAELMREGYAHVAVSAQPAGVTTLKTALDPVRYSALLHPGDQYSFDVFSQILRSVRQAQGVQPLGTLKAVRVLASGESQSAQRLYDYIRSGTARDAAVADAFWLESGGGTSFAGRPPSMPVLQFLGEDYTLLATASGEGASPATEPRSKSPNYRVWFVAGAPHGDSWALRYVADVTAAYVADDPTRRFDADAAGGYGERGNGNGTCPDNLIQKRYAASAAVHALDQWVRTSRAPASSAEFRYAADDRTLLRDADGNARGGFRLPHMDVPIAEYNGVQCTLVGYTRSFSDTKLRQRYPTFDDYYTRLLAAARRAIAGGHLRPADGDDLMARACRSAYRWPGSSPTCSTSLTCTDRQAPRTTLSRGSLRIGRRGVSLRGTATDRGCIAPRVKSVHVAVGREVGGGCRWLKARGGFTARRSCRKPLFLAAVGRESWRLNRRVALPRGRYELEARAVDEAGHVERLRRKARVAQYVRVG